jgi:hypothetical protein
MLVHGVLHCQMKLLAFVVDGVDRTRGW